VILYESLASSFEKEIIILRYRCVLSTFQKLGIGSLNYTNYTNKVRTPRVSKNKIQAETNPIAPKSPAPFRGLGAEDLGVLPSLVVFY
jgi:hypothetical protein